MDNPKLMLYTVCISTNNNLNYLRLAVESFRKNAAHNMSPIFVYAENCTDGTDEWLAENAEQYNIRFTIEKNEGEQIRGIGGGMNLCASEVTTPYILFLHSDMYLTPNFDVRPLELLEQNDKSVVGSFRIEPAIFGQLRDDTPAILRPGVLAVPLDAFGEYHHNFDAEYFNEYASELAAQSEITYPRVEGAGGYFIRKADWDYIGGNDDLFKPTWGEDMDLFLRMLAEGYTFITTTKSVIYHFAARGSHWKEDDLQKRSQRQIDSEQIGAQKWFNKWKEHMQFDHTQFIKLTPTALARYKELYDR
jgi:GT2 family glycosyltransferase